jgi:tellurite resistance protein
MAVNDDLEKASGALERVFFGGRNALLLAELKLQNKEAQQVDLLREVVKIRDGAFLRRLLTLGVRPEVAVAVALTPLVLVAWADGELHDRERDAILEAARQRGVGAEGIAGRLLVSALAQKPDPRLFQAWTAYARLLWGRFTPDECWQMRANVLDSAREVAEAAGGLLGLAKISAAERRVLDEIGALLA